VSTILLQDDSGGPRLGLIPISLPESAGASLSRPAGGTLAVQDFPRPIAPTFGMLTAAAFAQAAALAAVDGRVALC